MEHTIKNMPIIEKRKLVKSGASLVVSLPRKWLEENGLSDGGDILIRANGDLKIVVANQENVDEMNTQIENIRNQLNHNIPAGSPATSSNDSDDLG